MLHIVENFPISSSFLDATSSGDTVIFTENAVYAVKQDNIEADTLSKKALSHINLCVRKADLLIRDISNKELLRGVVVIDEAQYDNVVTQDFAIKSCN